MRLFSKSKNNEAWLAMVIAARRHRGRQRAPRRRGQAGGDGGRVLSRRAGAEALEKAGKELHSANYRCTTVLAGGEYQFMSVEAPNVPRDELKTAMRWRLKDMLDFPVDDATIDVLDLPLDPNAAVRAQQSVFAIAARNSVIQARQKLFARPRSSCAPSTSPKWPSVISRPCSSRTGAASPCCRSARTAAC
jgi:MSHA biogenesis protein MshI